MIFPADLPGMTLSKSAACAMSAESLDDSLNRLSALTAEFSKPFVINTTKGRAEIPADVARAAMRNIRMSPHLEDGALIIMADPPALIVSRGDWEKMQAETAKFGLSLF